MKYPLVMETTIHNLKILKRSPFWDIYQLEGRLLFVAMDRVEIEGQITNGGVPYKGMVVVKMLDRWFECIKPHVKTHYITNDLRKVPTDLERYEKLLQGRVILVKKTSVIPLQCVVRRHLVGNVWENYSKLSNLCGLGLKKGIEEGARLDEPVVMPMGEMKKGKKSYLSPGQVAEIVGDKIAEDIRDMSITAFRQIEAYATERDLILGETVFKFGLHNGEIVIIDEGLSAEETIFWDKKEFSKNIHTYPIDRAPLYEFLEENGWSSGEELPTFPDNVLVEASRRHVELGRRFTGVDVTEVLE